MTFFFVYLISGIHIKADNDTRILSFKPLCKEVFFTLDFYLLYNAHFLQCQK